MIKKFTKVEKTKPVEKPKDNPEIKFEGNYLKVIEYKDYEIVSEPSTVAILPYLRDEGFVLLRHEYVPTYQYYYKDSHEYRDIKNFLTIVSGTIEKGETVENAVRRELYEETGIVLSNLYQIEVQNSFFTSKGNVSKYYICLLELRYNDYKVTQPKTDGSDSEKLSRTIKVSLGDLDELKIHDLITEYMLTKFKLEYDIK